MPNDFDLTLLPLYRLDGQEMPALPGLLAITPPRRRARGRERDRLVIHLTLAGNAPSSTANYVQMTTHAAEQFYQTPGSLTSAMRAAAETLNGDLLERNLRTSGQGRYAIGHLTLGALRGGQFYFLECGRAHVFWTANGETKHIHDPQLSGRGLGLSQSTDIYFSQVTLAARGRLLICSNLPDAWKRGLLSDHAPASLEAMRRRLVTQTDADLNAVLIEAQPGRGQIAVLKPSRPKPEPVTPAVGPASGTQPEPARPGGQPSAYAIPPRRETATPSPGGRSFPPSIPRAAAVAPEPEDEPFIDGMIGSAPAHPPVGKVVARQTARTLAGGIRSSRRLSDKLSQGLRAMLPRLLPNADSGTPMMLPGWVMGLIAIATPLLVVTVASVVYFRFGRNVQYDNLYAQAEVARTRAIGQPDPIAQRVAWEETLSYLDRAEEYGSTAQSRELRIEAQNNLDSLLGITRIIFKPAVSGAPRAARITRMAATDTDLYLLDASDGSVLRAFLVSNNNYQVDDTFLCKPGSYSGYTVNAMVDILALPKVNALGATVMGIDGFGNLLYCAPNQVPQAISLALPDTNWGRVTAAVLDNDTLYVLDAPSRAVWVYTGQAAAFLNRPTFFFSEQVPDLEDAIDLVVNGDDLYLLHEDSRLTTCVYSRLDSVPTRCEAPAELTDPNPGAQGSDTFGSVHFTQMLFTAPPDSAILLLDSDAQAIFRFTPRSLELQNQLRPAIGDKDATIPSGPLTALAINPNHILFLALDDQIYIAMDVP